MSSVYDDMTTLCKMFCSKDLEFEMNALQQNSDNKPKNAVAAKLDPVDDEEEEEEEEEEEDD